MSTAVSRDADGSKNYAVAFGVNYAAKESGAEIIREMTSPTFVPHTSPIVRSAMNVAYEYLYKLGVESGVGPPEEAISADMSPGRCWAMQVTHLVTWSSFC